MTRRRRAVPYHAPDGHDWRDPQMPLYIPHLNIYVTAEQMQANSKRNMSFIPAAADYRHDTSYWWAQHKKEPRR